MQTIDDMIEDIENQKKRLDEEAVVIKVALIVFVALMILTIGGTLVGCANTTPCKETNTPENELFELVEDAKSIDLSGHSFFYIYRNTVTDTLFVYHYHGNGAEMCEMSNPKTGYPLTYEDYLQMKEDKGIKQ